MSERAPGSYDSTYHAPIMVDEVLEWLDVVPGGVYLDGTLGGGGHSEALLDACGPDGVVVGLDRDPEAIAEASARLARFGDRFTPVRANYSEAERVLEDLGIARVDGWLIDAGVSSHQLDDVTRGFSFRDGGPLDMRMGPDGPTLGEWLDDAEERDVSHALRVYGEVKGANRIARAILAARRAGKLDTTAALRDVVEGAAPRDRARKIHPATLAFQGLRIALNDEITHLESAVESVPRVVRAGGRAVFMSFHSLEDRVVKRGFRAHTVDVAHPPGMPVRAEQQVIPARVLTRKPIAPSADEIARNPRSRSARIRALEVLREM